MEAAIFDFDGVIVNTVPLHFKAWQRMFKEYGKDFNFEEYELKVDGIPRIDGARAVLTDLSEGELIAAGNRKQRYFLEYIGKEKIPVYDTTVDFINSLRENLIKTAIISSSKNCISILRKLNLLNLFDAAVTGDDVTKGKPDPQIFLMAAEKLSCEPAQCVVFEDAVLGIEAANRAGMKSVGIDRYGKPGRLKKADLVVSDLGKITVKKIKELM